MQINHVSKYITTIKAPIEKVWHALTDAATVKQYFFGSHQETNWEVGNAITWSGEFNGTKYLDKGIVQEFIPNQKLTYSYLSSWAQKEDKPENYLFVTYEVKEVSGRTELAITQSNYDAVKAQHSEQNWAVVIDGLKKIVEG